MRNAAQRPASEWMERPSFEAFAYSGTLAGANNQWAGVLDPRFRYNEWVGASNDLGESGDSESETEDVEHNSRGPGGGASGRA